MMDFLKIGLTWKYILTKIWSILFVSIHEKVRLTALHVLDKDYSLHNESNLGISCFEAKKKQKKLFSHVKRFS